jgi:hypothetical protein
MEFSFRIGLHGIATGVAAKIEVAYQNAMPKRRIIIGRIIRFIV